MHNYKWEFLNSLWYYCLTWTRGVTHIAQALFFLDLSLVLQEKLLDVLQPFHATPYFSSYFFGKPHILINLCHRETIKSKAACASVDRNVRKNYIKPVSSGLRHWYIGETTTGEQTVSFTRLWWKLFCLYDLSSPPVYSVSWGFYLFPE